MTQADRGAPPPSTTAPYGSWRSPITASLIAEGAIGLGQPQTCGDELLWVELRPLEGGRYVVVRRRADGAVEDLTPPAFNARTLVHEYGGGMYTPWRRPDGGLTVFFSELSDQRLYRHDLDAGGEAGEAAPEPRPMTPEPPEPRSLRYADGRVTADGRWLVVVRERHRGEDPDAVQNDLVAVPVDGGEPVVLASGHDFYAAPRPSPDGARLAWLSWDHPNMPWDGTELWVAELDAAGRLAAERLVAGGPSESVVQPSWSPDGRLHFISDRSGWWNLYRWEDQASVPAVEGDDAAAGTLATALAPLDAEFARPAWVFGLSSYDFLHDGRVVTVWTQEGSDQLGLLTPPPGTNAAVAAPLTPIPCPFTSVASLRVLGDGVALLGGSPTQGPTIALLDPAAGGFQEVRRNSDVVIDPGYLSLPEPIAFPTWYEPGSVRGQLLEELTAAGSEDQGAGGPRLVAHALYYAPSNHDVAAPPGERPPLVVISHGGPTSAAEAVLSLDIQFWTSRGFAVVDVNYGGSTGHGRAYRERLKGNWGVVDTVDCIRAAEYLVERGDVDPARLIVRGGSAGGYTTLNALTRHRVFAAGASLFGLADLEHFVSGGTHKFESRYLLGLVGPYPEEAELYRERSPITHVDDIACPVIVLQGLEDAIVPPAQAELIVEALRRKGLPHAYLAFEGEQHGFRKAENIVRSLEAELYFYGRVFGFTPADEIAPLPTAGL